VFYNGAVRSFTTSRSVRCDLGRMPIRPRSERTALLPPLFMTTDLMIDPSLATLEIDQLPVEPSDLTTELSEEPTLEEKFAAEQELRIKAENEVKRWKGRLEKTTKGDISEEEIDWKIANKDRVALVEETYKKELESLQELGAKPTLATKTKALELAEGKSFPQATTHSAPIPSAGIQRTGKVQPHLTEVDVAFGVKPETKSEYREFVEG